MDIHEYIESGAIESYVLGLADATEVVELERLKVQHPEIQKAIDDFSISLEEQAFKNAVTPPADIKSKLMADLAFDFSGSNVNALTVAYNINDNKLSETIPEKKFNTWRFAVAASVILLITSAAGNIFLYNKYSKANTQYQALLTERNSLQANNQVYQAKVRDYQYAAAMMADPSIAMVKMQDPAKKKNSMTTVFWDSRTKDVYFLANSLPAPSENKQYQLWALVDGKPVDAGMIDPNCTSLCRMKNIPRAQAFAVTLEKTGGSPTPSMDQLYVLGNI